MLIQKGVIYIVLLQLVLITILYINLKSYHHNRHKAVFHSSKTMTSSRINISQNQNQPNKGTNTTETRPKRASFNDSSTSSVLDTFLPMDIGVRNFSNFKYDLDINIPDVVQKRLRGEYVGIQTYNNFRNYIYTPNPCNNQYDLLIMIKSKYNHFEQRRVIRATWGNTNIVYQDSLTICTVFVLGCSSKSHYRFSSERHSYHDILLIDMIDSYYNNTLKTISSTRWASNNSVSNFVLFVDDDYFVNIENMLKLVLLLKQRHHTKSIFIGKKNTRNGPARNRKSKWYISLKQYQYDRYPPWISGGSFLISVDLIRKLKIAMEYTKLFIFDDIYLAIVAYRLKVMPRNHNGFRTRKVKCEDKLFRNILTTHRYFPKDIWLCWHARNNATNVYSKL